MRVQSAALTSLIDQTVRWTGIGVTVALAWSGLPSGHAFASNSIVADGSGTTISNGNGRNSVVWRLRLRRPVGVRSTRIRRTSPHLEGKKFTPEGAAQYVEELMRDHVHAVTPIYEKNNYVVKVDLLPKHAAHSLIESMHRLRAFGGFLDIADKKNLRALLALDELSSHAREAEGSLYSVIYKAYGGTCDWYQNILSYGGQVRYRRDRVADRFSRDVNAAWDPLFADMYHYDPRNRIVLSEFIEGETLAVQGKEFNQPRFENLAKRIHAIHKFGFHHTGDLEFRLPVIRKRLNEAAKAVHEERAPPTVFDRVAMKASLKDYGKYRINHPTSPLVELVRAKQAVDRSGAELNDRQYFSHLLDNLQGLAHFTQANFTMIHGDAKGPNYLAQPDDSVIALDAERRRLADPAIDVGEFLESYIRDTDFESLGLSNDDHRRNVSRGIEIFQTGVSAWRPDRAPWIGLGGGSTGCQSALCAE